MMKNHQLADLSDEAVIHQILQENKTGLFKILYDRYQKKIADKCYTLVKNHNLAKELSEDILSKIYEKLGSFRHRSSFSSWVYSVTYNHCIDYLRANKRLHYPDWNRENEIDEIIDNPVEKLPEINYENLCVILEMIHPEERTMLTMKYQDDISIKEIANSLRITEDAAKMRLKRARARVFQLYKKKFL
jgi:RNA polymerase sigma-70 factor (ECF subfamily)